MNHTLTPDEWNEVKRIFTEAVKRSAGQERKAFLNQACPLNSDIAREVNSLLAQHEKSALFMNGQSSLTGAKISHFEVVELLGQGGTAVVYRAFDTTLRRHVALKILSPWASIDILKKEALRLAGVNHPHVATIFEAGEVNNTSFIALELVNGRTLNEVLRPKRLPVQKTLHYALQIAETLAALHDGGIIHGDLKPPNIMVSGDWIKLLDFGAARVDFGVHPQLANASREEQSGTVAYMAPEQFSSAPNAPIPDKHSDMFAFGVVFYELLSGRHPFRQSTVEETRQAILKASPKPLPAKVPRALTKIVERCLAKRPKDRYGSMGDVCKALSRASRGGVWTDLLALPSFCRRHNNLLWVRGWRARSFRFAGPVLAGVMMAVLLFGLRSSTTTTAETASAVADWYNQGVAALETVDLSPCITEDNGSCDFASAIGTLLQASNDFNAVLKVSPAHGASLWKRGITNADLCKLHARSGEPVAAAEFCRRGVEDFTNALKHRSAVRGNSFPLWFNPANVLWNRAMTRVALAQLSRQNHRDALPAVEGAVSDLRQLLDPAYARLLRKSRETVLKRLLSAEEFKQRLVSGA